MRSRTSIIVQPIITLALLSACGSPPVEDGEYYDCSGIQERVCTRPRTSTGLCPGTEIPLSCTAEVCARSESEAFGACRTHCDEVTSVHLASIENVCSAEPVGHSVSPLTALEPSWALEGVLDIDVSWVSVSYEGDTASGGALPSSENLFLYDSEGPGAAGSLDILNLAVDFANVTVAGTHVVDPSFGLNVAPLRGAIDGDGYFGLATRSSIYAAWGELAGHHSSTTAVVDPASPVFGFIDYDIGRIYLDGTIHAQDEGGENLGLSSTFHLEYVFTPLPRLIILTTLSSYATYIRLEPQKGGKKVITVAWYEGDVIHEYGGFEEKFKISEGEKPELELEHKQGTPIKEVTYRAFDEQYVEYVGTVCLSKDEKDCD